MAKVVRVFKLIKQCRGTAACLEPVERRRAPTQPMGNSGLFYSFTVATTSLAEVEMTAIVSESVLLT
jgi:hypothetical protein